MKAAFSGAGHFWPQGLFFPRQSLWAAAVFALLLPFAAPAGAQPAPPQTGLYNFPIQPPGATAPRPMANTLNQTAANGQEGRHLGEIKEQSPLLPPPQQQNFAPLAPMAPLQELKPAARPQPQAAAPAVTLANYPLNEALLTRLEKIHAEILKLPELNDNNNDDDISGGVDVLVTAMEKRPDIMAILGRNLISARDYIFAMQAVSAALNAASGAEEAQVFGENNKISAVNLAFGEKYADRIRRLLEE